MPRKKKSKKAATPTSLILKPFGGIKISLPIPKLPWVSLGAISNLTAGASGYPNNVPLCFPVTPFQITVPGGTGLAFVTPINPTTVVMGANTFIRNWANLSSVFEEYCLTGFCLEFRYQSAGFQLGLVLVTIDEKDGTTPTALQYDKPHIEIVCSPNTTVGLQTVKWVPSDLDDLVWSPTTTTFTPVWLKYFSAISATTTGQIVVTGTVSVAFRGYTAD
jgi:hypothetical protein